MARKRVTFDQLRAEMAEDEQPAGPADVYREFTGLRCPKCKGTQFADQPGLKMVVKTKQVHSGITRYRICPHCGHRWSTVEH